MADQNRGRTSPAVPALSQAAASPPAEEYGNQAHKGQRQAGAGRPRPPGALTLRNWRVRWRVLALVVVPTVAAIVLGAVRVEAARATAAGFARISEVATLGRDFTTLTQSVEDERDLTAGYLASQQAGDKAQAAALLSRLQAQYGVTDTELTAARRLAGQVSPARSGNPRATRADVTSAMENLQVYLPDLRGFTRSQIDPLAMTNAYSQLLSPLLAFDSDIGAGSPDPQLAQLASLLGSAAQTEDQASQQRALLYAALFQDQFQPGLLSALTAAQTNQASSLAAFQAAGADVAAFIPASGSTPAGFSPALTQVQQFSNTVQGSAVDDAQRIELAALVAGQAGRQPHGGAGNATEWFTDMTSVLSQMRSFDATDLDAISSQAGTLQQGALGSERLTALIVLILLLAVLVITVVVARSMILPLRRLRADALDVASRRLPEMVRRLSETDQEPDSDIQVEDIQVEPIGTGSTDEIGEVARAFDQVHGEAVRLATGEATLRANLNAMFVNLSRRSQTLIERQLGIIEGLEQTEQDETRLGSLFRLDHLATRMRRNSENLLVLAGHEAPRKWTRPVVLVDVLRAAVSEIEQYERITLSVQPGLVIAGRAASDVVHLAAELVENAATFSRKGTQVHVTGQRLTSGGVLIEVTDEGLGIPEQELAYANWRLDNPPVIDVAVSRRMGLFVVGRLAARHGIKVRLRRATSGGLSALIWVPDTVAETEEPAFGPRRRFGSGGSPVMITSPAEAVAGPRTPVRGVRTPARPRSIWFDTGEGDAGLAPEPPAGAVHATVVPAPVTVEPPAGPQPAVDGMRDGARAQLPIYNSVESEWFRRGNPSLSDPAGEPSAGPSWGSPADEGFRRAAETARSPVAGQATSAGLPRRVPSANLVPGSIGARPAGQRAPQAPPGDSGPSRSPDAVRARMTGFQTRGRDGHPGLPQRPGTDQN
jgi:signal transduction histidine kinase